MAKDKIIKPLVSEPVWKHLSIILPGSADFAARTHYLSKSDYWFSPHNQGGMRDQLVGYTNWEKISKRHGGAFGAECHRKFSDQKSSKLMLQGAGTDHPFSSTLGSLFDAGDNSIENSVETAEHWAKEQADDDLSNTVITVRGHSRGGVASVKLVERLLNSNAPPLAVLLLCLDPVAGSSYDSHQHVSPDAKLFYGKTTLPIHPNLTSTVVYSIGESLPFTDSHQVIGADRYILTPLPHEAGQLDRWRLEGVEEVGQRLPPGYFLHTLSRLLTDQEKLVDLKDITSVRDRALVALMKENVNDVLNFLREYGLDLGSMTVNQKRMVNDLKHCDSADELFALVKGMDKADLVNASIFSGVGLDGKLETIFDALKQDQQYKLEQGEKANSGKSIEKEDRDKEYSSDDEDMFDTFGKEKKEGVDDDNGSTFRFGKK